MNQIDFWVSLGVSTFWASLIVVGIFAFGLGLGLMRLVDKGQIGTLKQRKELAEERLREIAEKNAGEAPEIASLRAELADMRKLISEKAPLSALLPLLDSATSSTTTLQASNIEIGHIVSAKEIRTASGQAVTIIAEVNRAKK